jgi:hypothetical protein
MFRGVVLFIGQVPGGTAVFPNVADYEYGQLRALYALLATLPVIVNLSVSGFPPLFLAFAVEVAVFLLQG